MLGGAWRRRPPCPFYHYAKFFVIHLAIRHKTEPPIESLQTMLAASLQSMRSVATWY
jgi:hypothetical protein